MSIEKIFQLLQFLILLNLSENKILEIPFTKKEILVNKSDLQVIKELDKNSLTCEFYLGTPYQKLYLNPKTERVYSYILEDNSRFSSKSLNLFNSSLSQSFEFLEKIKSFSWLYGNSNFIKEKAKIGNVETNLTLIQAELNEEILSLSKDSGVIGLGLLNSYENDLFKANFIKNLKQNGIINSYNFFIIFDDNSKGKIIIGAEPYEYDNKLFTKKINTFVRLPSTSNVFWGFDLDKITYNDINVKSLLCNAARIKLEYGFIGVGLKIKEIVDIDLFNELKDEGICNQINYISSYYYVCKKGKVNKNKLHSLNLFNKDFNVYFNIDFKELFFDYEDKTFFLVEFMKQDGSIYLGEPFLKKHLILFNQDSKTIGMYIKENNFIKKTEKIPKKLIFLLVLVSVLALSIICILLCCIYKYKKSIPKKKTGIELSEDTYSYQSFEAENKT